MKTILPTIMILLFLSWQVASAASMSNSSHILELNDNFDAPQPTPTPENKNIAPAPTSSSRIITGDNFLVYLSYDDDTKLLPFTFSTDGEGVNFGRVIPGEALVRSQSFSVGPYSSRGYEVLAYENHVLQKDSDSIPNTSCDNGNCTAQISDFWQNPLTYGFGYRCDNITGTACNSGFEDGKYKRFTDEAENEEPARIIISNRSYNSKAIISYRLNISGSQPQKGYQNIIYYIAVPSL